MANNGIDKARRGTSPWRIIGWGVAASILLLPLVAMQFTTEVNWGAEDFIFATVLIGGVGLLFELAVRLSPNPFYRAGIGAALAATFLTIWANAAVGMIGDEGNPLNLMFAGVIGIALLGAIVARFRAAGMGIAMMVAAVGQLLAGGIGAFTDLRGGILSATFAVLWMLSAMLFGRAARDEETPVVLNS